MVRISDIEIIEMLMENARMPYVRIAEKLGVSEAAVRKRVKKLEEKGVILKYGIEVDIKKLGFEVLTIIGMDVEPQYFLKAIDSLKRMKEVIKLYTSSGDHMLLMECWFKSSEELNSFVRRLEKIEGTKRICPAIIIERIK
ncbi:transcriptional regulator [Candidatus Bathyarchaeota archaeon ex4484_205]|nr:MAG: transcriptional regulator [Candidatus Bathyarchaeota archaeon ex4484_205]